MKSVLVTSSTGEPVTLTEVKQHLRISTASTAEGDEEVLNSLIKASRERIEDITNRKIMKQTWDCYYDEWPANKTIEIPYTPLIGVKSTSTGITYKKPDGNTTTMSSTKWVIDTVSEPGRVCLDYNEGWPTDTLHNVNPIRVRAIVGYGTTSAGSIAMIPNGIKLAMKMLIGHWFENRENSIVQQSIQEIPNGVKMLLQSLRVFKF